MKWRHAFLVLTNMCKLREKKQVDTLDFHSDDSPNWKASSSFNRDNILGRNYSTLRNNFVQVYIAFPCFFTI